MDRLSAALGHPVTPLESLGARLIQSLVTETAEDDVTLLLARTRAQAQ
jgi:hypothetical protein